MPIISLRDNENNRRKRNTKAKKQIKRKTNKQTNNKKRNTEEEKGDRSYSETVKAKWFCCTFKLGFLQLLCKTSLIFKSNLELALSIILKQRESYESGINKQNLTLQTYHKLTYTGLLLNFKSFTS